MCAEVFFSLLWVATLRVWGGVVVLADAWYTSGTLWAGAGTVAGVLGTVALVWVTFTVGLPRRCVFYQMVAAIPLVSAPRGMRGKLELRVDGEVVIDPHIVTIQLNSRGSRAAGLWRPVGWRERQRHGAAETQGSHRAAANLTRGPSRRLHRAYTGDLERPPDRGQAYSRHPRVKSAARRMPVWPFASGRCHTQTPPLSIIC
jgi:hypothetical protein